MEEKKLKKPEAGNPASKNQKLTYEQLNDACAQLSQQNQYLIGQLKAFESKFNQVNNAFRRLDCLFAVLRYADVIKDPEFIGNCVSEIKSLLTLPAKQEDVEENAEKSSES